MAIDQSETEPCSANASALNPTVRRLGVVSFLADISSEMLYPITPLFLTSVLGASMTAVGLIEGLADAVASLLKVYAGHWSDRTGRRKPFVVAGYLLAAVAKPLMGLATLWGHVLIARSIDRLGKGLRTAPRDALLAESTTAEARGLAFGWHRAMDTAGAALGPLLALFYLSNHADSLRTIYLYALIPGLLATAVSLTLKERSVKPIAQDFKFEFSSFSPQFKRYLIAWTVFSAANSSDVFLLMQVKSRGHSLSEVILFYCYYNLVYAGLSPLFGSLSDRWGRRPLLISGFGLFALTYLGFAFANQTWHFWILFTLYGLFMASSEGNGKAMVIDLAEPERKATALGVFGTVTGLAALLASTMAGVLWEQFGSLWTFVYAAIGATLAAILFHS